MKIDVLRLMNEWVDCLGEAGFTILLDEIFVRECTANADSFISGSMHC